MNKKRKISVPEESQKLAMRVSKNSIIANAVLSAFKLIAGVIGHSSAMISDAVHSASDVFSTIIVMIGIKFSHKASDKDHPYGHERLECVAGTLLSCVLFIAGAMIGYKGLAGIIDGSYKTMSIPGTLPIAAAVVSIITKEIMFWYTRNAAKLINSSAMMADAWHHRSDALSSIGSLAGIIGARLGFPLCDPVASLIICIFIIKAALDIFKDSMDKMVDKSCDDETLTEIRKVILSQDGVITLDDLKNRMFGSRLYIDVEIGVDGQQTLFDAHAITHKVHDSIENTFPEVKHCMVHANPVDLSSLSQSQVKASMNP